MCSSGRCACDPAWRGPTCGVLALLPAPATGNGDIAYVRRTNNFTWGGSIIAGGAREGFHMFAAAFPNGTLSDWETGSIVVRLEAPAVVGPYEYRETVAGPRGGEPGTGTRESAGLHWDSLSCHNPTVHRIGDEYVVFYIGIGVVPTGGLGADMTQSIGAAYAPSPRGPWVRLASPLLVATEGWECGGQPSPKGCGVSNPAVVVNEGGSVLLFYRGNNDRGVGVASAPEWRGPYTKSDESIHSNGIFRGSSVIGLEDMYVFRNPVGTGGGNRRRPGCHMVLHQEEAGVDNLGAHAFTDDPLCISGWALSTPRPSHAYGPEFQWDNATVTTFGSRERPQVVLDMATGQPIYLSNGVIVKPQSSGGWAGASFTVVAPINNTAIAMDQ